MSKKCAREDCGKTVYPIEELKCLDKTWHKQCFKCTVCGMTLSMKNYKGYDKKPYCDPHYPKTVASVVADTPEMRRIAENTKNQSNIKYHAEYEKMKGTKIEIADDPEMERLKKNTQVQSNVSYHGVLGQKARQEEVRPKEEISPNPTPTPISPINHQTYSAPTQAVAANSHLIYSSEQGGAVSPTPQKTIGSIADYDPLNGQWGTAANQPRNSEKLGYLKNQVDKGPARFCADFAGAPPSSVSSTSPHSTLSSPQSAVSPTGKAGFAVKAIYDYAAADKDEISFLEGDIIVNCEKIDDGWMTGTVQRTLQWGMLPANYVQPHKLPTGLHRLS
ncbi:hypothetical protein GCK72_010146 [Caenorhabditis remanei]|uniref:Uncharacterized protein n=3 Tax=Caenorhabditis TaxID=6237 RepID=E3MI10_CAERE|nr:hypothetical protein GCK72_010146 [Caenorhabditis remanei]EFP02389.1 hypothetical protein CRE_01043 [Caenorhabditis remanei]KAF1761887.1 hypothetical protein GCK72_010146 [Caenorhabditis remanei]